MNTSADSFKGIFPSLIGKKIRLTISSYGFAISVVKEASRANAEISFIKGDYILLDHTENMMGKTTKSRMVIPTDKIHCISEEV